MKSRADTVYEVTREPLAAEASKDTVACVPSTRASTEAGASGTLSGITQAAAVPAEPVPTPLVAVTEMA